MIVVKTSAGASLEVARLRVRLREAQDEHDCIRRDQFCGVSTADLARDHQHWETLGEAIAGLARLIADRCADSAFNDFRPHIALLTARLSEAIDDLIDEPAWTVIDAAARLAAERGP